MDENKKEFGGFYGNRGSEDREANDQERSRQEEPKADKPSYYYSYGPYKSTGSGEANDPDAAPAPQSGGFGQVEVTPPRPVRQLEEGPERSVRHTVGAWTPAQPRKRSSARSLFAAFLAGAIVLGGFTFASDKYNWFGGQQGVMGSAPAASSAPAAAASGTNNSLKTSALDIARPNNIAQMVQQSSPAVVKIETYSNVQQRQGRGSSLFNDPFFRQFFGDDSGTQQAPTPQQGLQMTGMGSGFIFEKDGYILTNEHVVEGADQIKVTLQGNEKAYDAKLLGNSFDLDLAVLKIEGNDFPTLPLGDADQLNVGDWVVAIGNPYGFDHTVTVGVLSAKERPIDIPEGQQVRNYKHLLQTDASINPGNSGGPLLNLNGEVIGINTAVNAQAQGIGFAIPTSTIKEVLDNLKNNVKIPKQPAPYIGVTLGDITADVQKGLNLDSTDGSYVNDVIMGSPGFKAGLKKYDVITGLNGTPVKTKEALISKIQAMKVGDTATLSIVRDGQKKDVKVTIGDKNNDPALQQQAQQ